jgi:hypothetical protein
MGLDINGVKFLLHSQRHGVSFARTAMIGRQSMLIGKEEFAELMREAGENEAAKRAGEFTGEGAYAEPLLRFLGAEEIVSFDASDYESASVMHDFNEPIGDEYKARFSAVLDGGTLEHVFNYPQALMNCMEMLGVGGHFLAITPGNNYLGHGFYQFSPELFFRVFSDANGFELERMLVFEEIPNCDWYEITDPDAIRERVTLVNGAPSLLLIVARRTAIRPIFETAPQQSDYFAMWNAENGNAATMRKPAVQRTGLSRVTYGVWKRLQREVERRSGWLETRPKHFKKFDPLER